jgi:hypothetical protein
MLVGFSFNVNQLLGVDEVQLLEKWLWWVSHMSRDGGGGAKGSYRIREGSE